MSLNPKATFRSLCLVAIAVATIGTASAQTVVYDWSSNAKVPESYPTIRRRQNVKFRITKVNDILFTYRLHVTQTPSDVDDFKHIAALFNVFNTPSTTAGMIPGCPGQEIEVKRLIQVAIDAIRRDPKLPIGYAESATHTSIPLQDSIDAWRSHTAAIKEAVDEMNDFKVNNQCQVDPTLENAFKDFLNTAQAIDAKVNSSHVYEDTHELSPGNDVSVEVVESFNSQTIQTKTFKFSTGDVLTLSAGALFSTIADRSYEARKSPTSTLNVVTVEGNSRATPGVVALLNYSLGALGLDGDTAGLALSAGPVVKFGGKSETSSFGFFTGISTHLYHRFYITPGFHFGQFSDFPVGFGNGSTVPANFGELTPVKRWTAKFGLAITFKTKDFSSLTSSGTPSVETEEGGGSNPNPAPTPSPTPSGNSGNNTSNNLSSLINNSQRFERRRAFLMRDNEAPQPTQTSESTIPEEPGSQTAVAGSRSFIRTTSNQSAVLHVTSVRGETSQTDERMILIAASPITEYAQYFKAGRFYLVIPNGRLDVLQDELRGRAFSEPVIEKQKNNLVISLTLLPGTRVSIVERPSGLEVVFLSASAN